MSGDIDFIMSILSYFPDTGFFVWKKNGKIAGYIDEKGYVRVTVKNSTYKAHRLAWAFVHGVFPDMQVDHINRVKSDNRICNLRCVTDSENQQNVVTPRRNNKTGYRGVVELPSKKYAAHIWMDGAPKYLGRFDTPQEAHNCYMASKIKHHSGYVS